MAARWLLALWFVGCGETSTEPVPAAAEDVAVADVAADVFEDVPEDIVAAPDVPLEPDDLGAELPPGPCETGVGTCEELEACASEPPLASYVAGANTVKYRSLVKDFTLPTTEGDWTFSDHVDGRTSVVVFLTATGQAKSLDDYLQKLWGGDVAKWLAASPRGVHYVFMWYSVNGAPAGTERVLEMKDRVDAALATMSDVDRCHWQARIHFVADTAAQTVKGWFKTIVNGLGGPLVFGIDRAQRLRQVGLLQNVATGTGADIGLIAYEVRHYDFEWDREQALAAETVTLVPLHEAKDGAGFTLDVQFPPAEEMATYDTMELDVGAWCKDHKDENCGEWDYIANLSLCELPSAPNPDAATACQPHVAATDTTPEVPAETKACTCDALGGGTSDHVRTCNGDGLGFGECACGCVEAARWITTYRREGRWVSDATPFLAFVSDGAKHRFSFNAANMSMVDMTVRLSNRGKGYRPFKLAPLFGGGGFGASYNDKYAPLAVSVPADTKRAEVWALITGHGWGVEKENCAEFCKHSHHFGVNGQEFVKEHPVAGALLGCADQVDQGVVPNQAGTWSLGRAGWCPGLDVKPFAANVTSVIQIGANNEVTYKALFKGKPYVPAPAPNPNGGGFGANIDMTSWLVMYR